MVIAMYKFQRTMSFPAFDLKIIRSALALVGEASDPTVNEHVIKLLEEIGNFLDREYGDIE